MNHDALEPAQRDEKLAGFHIVGVGASAGGLDAFTDLLQPIGDFSSLAIVFVQHPEPTRLKLLVEVISKATPFEVVPIDEPVQPHAGIVYVCPPQTELMMNDAAVGRVTAEPTSCDSKPIDDFFHRLAANQGSRAIGVILCCWGSDGTLGLKAISDVGGLMFAQEPTSAKFDSMPRSAATTGVADHIMTPIEIAKKLKRYVQHLAVQSDDDVIRPRCSAVEGKSGDTSGKVFGKMLCYGY